MIWVGSFKSLQSALCKSSLNGAPLEVHTRLRSEIRLISPFVDRLMSMIAASHRDRGKEQFVELALREGTSHAMFHHNPTTAQKKTAQIKITTYNRAGVILSDNDFWPASNDNIPANSEFPFEWLHTKVVFANFMVTIISVKSWPEALERHFPSNPDTANALTPSN